MTTTMPLSGWWRLWIFLSLVWLSAIAAYAYSTWPSEAQAAHHPAFIYQLELKQRQLLALDGASQSGTAVDMPNGHRLQFQAGVEEAAYTSVARAYQEITVRAQAEARREHLHDFLALALMPSLGLAVLGVGIAWVRSGFKEHGR